MMCPYHLVLIRSVLRCERNASEHVALAVAFPSKPGVNIAPLGPWMPQFDSNIAVGAEMAVVGPCILISECVVYS